MSIPKTQESLMKRTIFVLLGALALAACGQAVNAGTPSPSPSKSATTVDVASNAALGSFLTTATGQTLYYFTPEHDSQIACTGQCATIWHPFLAPSGLLTTKASLPGTLTTIPRDGSRQVTYSDWPLYTFSGDKSAGDTNGQGILGKWFVASISLMEDLPTPTPVPAPTVRPTQRSTPAPAPASCIPGANGGDHDGDNNGAPSDGDGCK
jgi:predicted lipoprotein with Yx(FWY)xxD motif